ncbi:type 1 periplasmic binding fold superfamily protein [Sungkyunkwania multivorans]|uniref:Type 1 periplasmic binding fold superfamily protein n=1 Tax=Sungkyunkwania multivorans TaxID=1173618 RepID=A0ABW3D1N2_9FLAO
MKLKRFYLTAFLAASLGFISCSDDDTPGQVNEEEVITTMRATLTPQGSLTGITLQTQDLDGDGPNPPVVTVSGDLAANTTYDGEMVVLNETENPVDDITEEVKTEAAEHQFIFVPSGALNATIDYADMESDYPPNTGNNPVGVAFTLTTGAASSGTLQIVLRHEPNKPNDGTLAGAGGETDITATFDITVQ